MVFLVVEPLWSRSSPLDFGRSFVKIVYLLKVAKKERKDKDDPSAATPVAASEVDLEMTQVDLKINSVLCGFFVWIVRKTITHPWFALFLLSEQAVNFSKCSGCELLFVFRLLLPLPLLPPPPLLRGRNSAARWPTLLLSRKRYEWMCKGKIKKKKNVRVTQIRSESKSKGWTQWRSILIYNSLVTNVNMFVVT